MLYIEDKLIVVWCIIYWTVLVFSFDLLRIKNNVWHANVWEIMSEVTVQSSALKWNAILMYPDISAFICSEVSNNTLYE